MEENDLQHNQYKNKKNNVQASFTNEQIQQLLRVLQTSENEINQINIVCVSFTPQNDKGKFLFLDS